MSSRGIKSPPIFSGDGSYIDWKYKVETWCYATDVPEAKQAAVIFLSLSGKAQSAVSEIPVDTLRSDGGVKAMLTKLDGSKAVCCFS